MYCRYPDSSVSGSTTISICPASCFSRASHFFTGEGSRKKKHPAVSPASGISASKCAVHVKSAANAISAGSHIISSSPKLTPSHTRVSSDFRGSRNRTHVHPAARNTSRYKTPRNAVMKELPSNKMVYKNKKAAIKTK